MTNPLALENVTVRIRDRSGRIVVTYYNYLWEPLLKTAEAMGIRAHWPAQNWLNVGDLENLLNLGLITQEQTETHPERNKVLNCLGSPFEPSIEVNAQVPLRSGDVLLLCSDGFWSGIDEADMARELDKEPVMAVVPRLVRRAVQHNGVTADNTTALALQWDSTIEVEDIPTLSSLGLPDGAVTTTIAIGVAPGPEAEGSDLTEDEIERTIAEIQSAIQRSNRDSR